MIRIKTSMLPADTEARLKTLYRLQQLLIIFHNRQAEKYRSGEMSLYRFRQFQRLWCKPRNRAICREMNNCKHKIPTFVENWKKSPKKQQDVDSIYKQAKHDKNIEVSTDCFEVV